MAKPEDIPQDVWDGARPAYEELFRIGAYRGAGVAVEPQAVIARATMAERERIYAVVAKWGKASGHAEDGSFGALLGFIKDGEGQ